MARNLIEVNFLNKTLKSYPQLRFALQLVLIALVSRIFCNSENYEMELVLDVNVDIYPMELGTKFSFALAGTLSLDGAPDEGMSFRLEYLYVHQEYLIKVENPRLLIGTNMLCMARYLNVAKRKRPLQKCIFLVIFSLTYLYCSIFVSFGGLLMMLKGDPRNLKELEVESRIYLLMRKV